MSHWRTLVAQPRQLSERCCVSVASGLRAARSINQSVDVSAISRWTRVTAAASSVMMMMMMMTGLVGVTVSMTSLGRPYAYAWLWASLRMSACEVGWLLLTCFAASHDMSIGYRTERALLIALTATTAADAAAAGRRHLPAVTSYQVTWHRIVGVVAICSYWSIIDITHTHARSVCNMASNARQLLLQCYCRVPQPSFTGGKGVRG